MPDANDWNAQVIAEFRANGGRVGGSFEGAPMVLVHHRGRRSGREYVHPMMYLADEADADVIYVFASKAGAPTHPDWYGNLAAHPEVTAEIGAGTRRFRARTAAGDERERIWARQKRNFPNFAEYEAKTDRVIPVVVLEPA